MRTRIATLLVAALCAQVRVAAAAPRPDLHRAMELLTAQRYEQAVQALDCIEAHYPGHPDILHLRLAIRQTHIVDYESFPFEAAGFLAFADSALSLLDTHLRGSTGEDSLRYLFYLGNAWGAIGLMQAKQGNWLSGFRAAARSRDMLAGVYEKDPSYHAAQLGVGMYNYYLGQGLRWLPFVSGRREEGLQQIREAARAVFPYNMAAMNTLCWIFIESGQYHAADSLCREALLKMPRNTIFIKVAATVAWLTGDWQEALHRGRELAQRSLVREPVNWNDVYTGYRIAAEAYLAEGRLKERREVAVQALAYEIPGQYLKISYVREHRERLRVLAR